MTREELYNQIFKSILDNHLDIIEDGENVSGEYDLNGLNSEVVLNAKSTNSAISRLMSSMFLYKNSDELDDYSSLIVEQKAYRKDSNKRNFIRNSSDLSVINGDDLFKDQQCFSQDQMLVVEKLCYKENDRIDFLNYLKNTINNGNDKYYIVYDSSVYTNSEELYMYGLSLCLNSGCKFDFDSNLNYKPPQSHCHSIMYNNNVTYCQYIDIYDVISEWNCCTDVLAAFLKMYQVLEYMIYRSELIKIINGVTIKQSFVKNLKGIDSKYGGNERETFISGLKEILGQIFYNKVIDNDVTPDVEKFCKTYFRLNKNGNTYMTRASIGDENQVETSVAKFIYDIRCCIVHNKESEFHMTTINFSEYCQVIPLMKKILEIVASALFEHMNKDLQSGNKILFENPTISLY